MSACAKKAASESYLPAPPLTLPVTAQLQAANGMCWETTHAGAGVLRNDVGQFKAKDDDGQP